MLEAYYTGSYPVNALECPLLVIRRQKERPHETGPLLSERDTILDERDIVGTV
jgi:hypothetical protein